MELIQFNTLGGLKMNTLIKLQEKQRMLSERASQLKSSLKRAEKNITGENIPEKASEIQSLEIQLQLTEKALETAQEQQRELEKKLNSKEYKDKLKQAEELRKQAEEETRTILKNLFEMQAGIQEVNDKLKQYNRLKVELTGNAQVYGVFYSQPFAWLQLLKTNIEKRISDSKFIKLEV